MNIVMMVLDIVVSNCSLCKAVYVIAHAPNDVHNVWMLAAMIS